MKNTEIRFLLVLFLAAIASCTYNISKLGPSADSNKVLFESADDISYQLVNDAVLAPKCLNCHSNATGNKGSVNLENYASVKLWLTEINEQVATKQMPPTKTGVALSTAQINLITTWISNGASEFAKPKNPTPITTPPSTPEEPIFQIPTDPKEITFAMVKKVLFEPQCIKCHSSTGTKEGDVALDNYAEVEANMSDIHDDIVNGYMPRGKDAHLTDEQLKIFFDWYDAGHLENPKTN